MITEMVGYSALPPAQRGGGTGIDSTPNSPKMESVSFVARHVELEKMDTLPYQLNLESFVD